MNFSEEENIFFAKLVERFGLLTKPERSSLWKMNVTEFNTTTGKNVDSKLLAERWKIYRSGQSERQETLREENEKLNEIPNKNMPQNLVFLTDRGIGNEKHLRVGGVGYAKRVLKRSTIHKNQEKIDTFLLIYMAQKFIQTCQP